MSLATMSLKVFVPSLLVLALGACAVGPDYKAPQTEAANITTATDGAAGQKNFDRPASKASGGSSSMTRPSMRW